MLPRWIEDQKDNERSHSREEELDASCEEVALAEE